jgi:G:T-mismatch repair DNA endonuclease (very short patch repair protein)
LRNQRRDHEVNRALKAKRWHVVRVWEHELKQGRRVARRLLRVFAYARLKRMAVSDEMNRR